jgi:hypothetical protein
MEVESGQCQQQEESSKGNMPEWFEGAFRKVNE